MPRARPSVLLSALIVLGMLLALLGAVAALLGLGGAAPETFAGLGLSVSSAGPGLVIATLGISLIFIATRKVRGGVQIFAIAERTPLERGADLVPWLLLGLLALDAIALLWWRLG